MQITPSVDSAVFYFGVNTLHFSETFFGTVLLVDGAAQVLGELGVLPLLLWMSMQHAEQLPMLSGRCGILQLLSAQGLPEESILLDCAHHDCG